MREERNASGCYEILNPAVNDPAADVDDDVGDDLYEPIRGRHYFWSNSLSIIIEYVSLP